MDPRENRQAGLPIAAIAGVTDDARTITRMLHQCYRDMMTAGCDWTASITAHALYEQLAGVEDPLHVSLLLVDVWAPEATGPNRDRQPSAQGREDLGRTSLFP